MSRYNLIQNTDLSDGVVPEPCTTVQDLCEANTETGECFAEIDTTRFATTIDRLIIEVLSTHYLEADIYHGKIYNPRTGKILKSLPRPNGYLYVSLHLNPAGKWIKLPVHRMIYYAAHPGTVLGQDFDIHHIDGNVANNRYENLQKVPRKYHSLIGAFTSQTEAEEGYIRYTARIKHGTCMDVKSIKALRVCSNQLPFNAKRKRVIYDYFAEKMHTSGSYCKHLTHGRSGKSILPATPEEEEEILKEYAWLIEKVRAGKRGETACTSN